MTLRIHSYGAARRRRACRRPRHPARRGPASGGLFGLDRLRSPDVAAPAGPPGAPPAGARAGLPRPRRRARGARGAGDDGRRSRRGAHHARRRGVDAFDLVGLSLGGAIAQAVAAAAPQRVRRLALACTATSFGGAEKWTGRAELTAAEGMAPMVEGVLGLWVSEDFARRHRATTEWLRAMIAATDGAGYAVYARVLAGFNSAAWLGRIACPVLTVAGAQDVSTPPERLAEIAAGVAGPVESVVVPGAHVPTFEAREEVNAALTEFLG